jgi:hypothetical protein
MCGSLGSNNLAPRDLFGLGAGDEPPGRGDVTDARPER